MMIDERRETGDGQQIKITFLTMLQLRNVKLDPQLRIEKTKCKYAYKRSLANKQIALPNEDNYFKKIRQICILAGHSFDFYI